MLTGREVEYPYSDGEPMTDQDINRLLMEYTEFAIRNWFGRAASVYVSANLYIFYDPDDRDKKVAPDVFVVKGVENRLRRVYLLWEEGRAPDVVFEFTSRSSRFDDAGTKLGLYALLGVPEYYVFDATGEYLRPRTRAYRLDGNLYREVPWEGEILSPALGLLLRVEGEWLRFVDPATGEVLPTNDEALEQAKREAERAKREAERAKREAERAQRLEEHLDRLRRRLEEAGLDAD